MPHGRGRMISALVPPCTFLSSSTNSLRMETSVERCPTIGTVEGYGGCGGTVKGPAPVEPAPSNEGQQPLQPFASSPHARVVGRQHGFGSLRQGSGGGGGRFPPMILRRSSTKRVLISAP